MDKYLSKYSFNGVANQKVSLADLRAALTQLLQQNDELYVKIEELLTEPGVTGRSSWDLCLAVRAIVDFDTTIKGLIAQAVGNKKVTMPQVGAQLMKVLKNANFIIDRGRIVGFNEPDETIYA